jgi:hypothetical protein
MLLKCLWFDVKIKRPRTFVFHNVGTSILITEFLHGWDQYSPSFANFLRVLLINFEWQQILKDFLQSELEIENVQFHNVHRLKPRRDRKPPSIVAKFVYNKDKNSVLVSRISITMDIRIITKCGMILYSSFWGYVKSSIYVQFVFHNVGTSILITEFLHGWDQYSPSFANFLRVLLSLM